jgi:hypothetical protein
MIEVKLNGESINIPTSWEDVPFKNYIKMLSATNNIEILNSITGIDKETLLQLAPDAFGTLFMLISFTNEAPPATLTTPIPFDIGKESYGKIEVAKAKINAAEKPFMVLIDLLKLYTGVDYSDRPTTEANPIGAFFLLNSINFSPAIND